MHARQIISTALGVVLPNLISRKATHHAASVLYVIFGVRLLWIAWRSKPQDSNQARAAPAVRAGARMRLDRAWQQRHSRVYMVQVLRGASLPKRCALAPCAHALPGGGRERWHEAEAGLSTAPRTHPCRAA